MAAFLVIPTPLSLAMSAPVTLRHAVDDGGQPPSGRPAVPSSGSTVSRPPGGYVAPAAVCAPRPPVRVTTTAREPGQLSVTVSAGAGPLRQIEFRAATNAIVDIGANLDQRPPFTYAVPAGTSHLSFVVWQGSPGTSSFLPFLVTDDCPDVWPTFVGGGTASHAREQGYAVSFFRDEQSPHVSICPAPDQIRADIEYLVSRNLANAIRLYGQNCNLDLVPALARQHHLAVYAAAYCDHRTPVGTGITEREIQSLIVAARGNANVRAAIVCNEGLTLDPDLPPKSALIAYIKQVKQLVSIPVTTAEAWSIWRDNPDLAAEVDLLLVHAHPYSNGQCIQDAARWVIGRMNDLRAQYPNKRIVLGETGWPTAGPTRGCAVPSVEHQERFLAELLPALTAANVPFFLLEPFDQTWKTDEGLQGPHWGTHTAERAPKHGRIDVWP
jgi:exo-beta-1,3-glucanase (GH17 family)